MGFGRVVLTKISKRATKHGKKSFVPSLVYTAAAKEKKTQRRRCIVLCVLIIYLFCLPAKLFDDPTSTVILDRNEKLLGAHIANDGQWRFEDINTISPKMEQCLIAFEDRRFYNHFGVSFPAILRAVLQNVTSKRRISGGSTITMQLVRMMRKNPKRTYFEKIIEIILATRVELHYSKAEILALYTSHAPYGNNVVGINAASWRYFGRKASELSWAECATLAVLPNAPGLIYPGKNSKTLRDKRDRLLGFLFKNKQMSAIDYQLAVRERIPQKPLPLPRLAPHLLNNMMKNGNLGKTNITTIDINLQRIIERQVDYHSQQFRDNDIKNAAVVVCNIKTGEVISYLGNTNNAEEEDARDVDCANASRSTGSILKPILYGKALENGTIAPKALLLDIPSKYGGFSPKNFNKEFAGAIPADEVVSRSLNVPMVKLLAQYGVSKFHNDLQSLGLKTINKPASHYGLALILGGAEARLTDLCNVYLKMAQELKYQKVTGIKMIKSFTETPILTQKKVMNCGVIWSVFQSMLEVNRPDEYNNWKTFSSSQNIAWKTGTSYGFRDAWSIGVSSTYVVAVWVGNAHGEGRPGLTGITAAAPLMFDIFQQLPSKEEWFKQPTEEMAYVQTCKESGFLAAQNCVASIRTLVPKSVKKSPSCPYHQLAHISKTSGLRVNANCSDEDEIIHNSWFVLPPLVEKYYKAAHPNYVSLPELDPRCSAFSTDLPLVIVYPKMNAKILVPVQFDGTQGKVIFEAAHRNEATTLYWNLDNIYLGKTTDIHQWSCLPTVGKHVLSIIDQVGYTDRITFEVAGKSKN
jgi:penicillin-binding protein 1C